MIKILLLCLSLNSCALLQKQPSIIEYKQVMPDIPSQLLTKPLQLPYLSESATLPELMKQWNDDRIMYKDLRYKYLLFINWYNNSKQLVDSSK